MDSAVPGKVMSRFCPLIRVLSSFVEKVPLTIRLYRSYRESNDAPGSVEEKIAGLNHWPAKQALPKADPSVLW